jgi:hypothetical protein
MILWSAIMQCSLLHIKKKLSCSWINLLHVSSSLNEHEMLRFVYRTMFYTNQATLRHEQL